MMLILFCILFDSPIRSWCSLAKASDCRSLVAASSDRRWLDPPLSVRHWTLYFFPSVSTSRSKSLMLLRLTVTAWKRPLPVLSRSSSPASSAAQPRASPHRSS
ncbi:hypothetical protein B0H67DRAFT_578795 [Lasiosphaeris hirsuta]|uniref:Secreted protein n=1 Tax=Lasiosphaeris hirsuta TaxID=260670 RepID=A0AA40AF55_9PEZI|nr:hypothetical protein B0H67DRAFT_578795 [Lasiosphaeris hirsuta]